MPRFRALVWLLLVVTEESSWAIIWLDNTLDARRDLKGMFHSERSEGRAGTR